MGPMGNGGTRDMRYRGMSNRVQGYGAYWQWGTRSMGHMGNGIQGVWGIWAMRPTGGYGYRGMGYKGYGPCGQWDTGLWAMGPVGDLLPKYQKDVELSKRCQVVKCQKMKHLDYGGGSQKN